MKPFWGATFPDSIAHATRALQGRRFEIHTPGELAEALRNMETTLAPVLRSETSTSSGKLE